jgi:hypothetical protein
LRHFWAPAPGIIPLSATASLMCTWTPAKAPWTFGQAAWTSHRPLLLDGSNLSLAGTAGSTSPALVASDVMVVLASHRGSTSASTDPLSRGSRLPASLHPPQVTNRWSGHSAIGSGPRSRQPSVAAEDHLVVRLRPRGAWVARGSSAAPC